MSIFYTKEHEWVAIEGETATLGITAYAAKALGDVVFVELPEPGRMVKAGEAVAVVESVKAASDVYAPLAGTVLETNTELVQSPQNVNADPAGAGWFCKLALSGTAETAGLMNATEYSAFCEGL